MDWVDVVLLALAGLWLAQLPVMVWLVARAISGARLRRRRERAELDYRRDRALAERRKLQRAACELADRERE